MASRSSIRVRAGDLPTISLAPIGIVTILPIDGARRTKAITFIDPEIATLKHLAQQFSAFCQFATRRYILFQGQLTSFLNVNQLKGEPTPAQQNQRRSPRNSYSTLDD